MKNYYNKLILSTILFLIIGLNNFIAQTHISTPTDLRTMEAKQGGDFILDNDIDMTSESWNQFDFSGTLDGNGFSILNLNINHTGDRGGMFNNIDGATIKNLGLENLTVNTPNAWAGGIAGNSSSSTITKCFISGTITSNGFAGGFLGHAFNTAITECYSTANVTGHDHVGGLVGHMNTGTVENCYVDADVISTGWQVGGLVGWATSLTCTINNSFAMGTVKSEGGFTGGILGIADGGAGAVIVSNCIAMQSGIESTNPDIEKTYRIVANENGETAVMTNNYAFDFMSFTDPHKAGFNDGVVGKDGDDLSSAQFKDTAFYIANLSTWDYTTVWGMTATGPKLRWQDNIVLSINTFVKSRLKVYTDSSGYIHINGAQKGSEIFIYDITGKTLENKLLEGSSSKNFIQSSGLLLVRVNTDNSSEVFKVIN
jgi:hypothetical protein